MSNRAPNIVLIITDQQRYDTIAALGYPYAMTPNMDRLVDEGTSFSHTFVSSPSCAPSRASLFTGLFPHTTGVFNNEDVWRHSWVEILAGAGYHCVNIGKMHTYPWETPMGFHERYVVENKERFYPLVPHFFDEWDKALRVRGLRRPGREDYRQLEDYKERLGAFEWQLPEEMHPDFFVGDLATWWIEEHPKEEPLFLQIGFPGPHPPYDPISRFVEPYKDKELPLPTVTEAEIERQPEFLRALRRHHAGFDHDAVVHLLDPTPEQLHRQRAYYLANVTMIDEKIGQVLSSLETRGYLEESIIVLTSDHGDSLGDHGHSQKWTMYDEAVRVPMVVWAPSRFQGGREVDELVQLQDLGPTLLELAGLQAPATMEARSLLPVLGEETTTGRRYVFAEQNNAFSERNDDLVEYGWDDLPNDTELSATEYMTMIRDHEWKLVHYVGSDSGQLFDLRCDPSEKTNLWDAPDLQDKKGELLGAILAWRARSDLRTREWSAPWR